MGSHDTRLVVEKYQLHVQYLQGFPIGVATIPASYCCCVDPAKYKQKGAHMNIIMFFFQPAKKFATQIYLCAQLFGLYSASQRKQQYIIKLTNIATLRVYIASLDDVDVVVLLHTDLPTTQYVFVADGY